MTDSRDEHVEDSTTLAIALADKSLYPLTDPSGEFYKNIILTPAKTNQQKALIRFCQIQQGQPNYETLGVLELDDLPTLANGELEIDLELEVDSEGVLSAVATEKQTFKSNRITIPLPNLSIHSAGVSTISSHENLFSLDQSNTATFDGPIPEAEQALYEPLDDSEMLEEETTIKQQSQPEKSSKGKGWMLIVLLLLLLLLGALGIWWLLRSPTQQEPIHEQPTPVTQPIAPVQEPQAQEQPAETQPQPDEQPPVVSVQPEPPTTATPTGTQSIIIHRIRWGDTLWHLSRRFYGTPWRFPEIAEFNQIPNPDLIIAGEDLEIPIEE